MKRRNRSPGLGAMALIGTLVIGLPVCASEIGEPEVLNGDQATALADAPATHGVMSHATVRSERSVAASCRKGKRVIGTSSNYVVRAAIKSAASNCYTCCADKVFFDNFESSDTSAWSITVGE